MFLNDVVGLQDLHACFPDIESVSRIPYPDTGLKTAVVSVLSRIPYPDTASKQASVSIVSRVPYP